MLDVSPLCQNVPSPIKDMVLLSVILEIAPADASPIPIPVIESLRLKGGRPLME